MDPQVVFVHGIRTSATMWRAQVAHLQARGVAACAIDLPGHGSRMAEPWSLEEAIASIDRAVRAAAERGPVLLVGHSMGGLLSTAYVGRAGAAPPVAAFVAASCTAFPRGAGLAAYRLVLRGMRGLPHQGRWVIDRALAAQLPPGTRGDFGAGGYALQAEDEALESLQSLDLARALVRIERRDFPVWFFTGEWDQLRLNERTFTRLVPRAELVVVPRSTHLVTAMRPAVTNALVDLALATVAARGDRGRTC
ncbi:alpha/beta fold hydrolase [Microbacterium excoecariae]|uniref:alpha/beta fold hydrolase n=1 Tax=Microbacterium excoecariae TaxID=2715210 RepID=UPI0014073572|nr:alpha/beta hydrolase [Microbacterium excoecariae]NHI17023.1 alpha/beta hydrolase [Microbacterium excoecariae]